MAVRLSRNFFNRSKPTTKDTEMKLTNENLDAADCCERVATTNLSFGKAIEALKRGQRVCRTGWNGKGMYLWLLPAATVKAEWCRETHLKAVAESNGGQIECLGSIRMMTADKKVLTGWLASQTDMLSEDWMILD